MIYTLFAPQFFVLPEQVKEQIQRYLKKHGINPDVTYGFTIDYELRGIWCRQYETILGQAYVDPVTLEPKTFDEWHPLKDGEPKPDFLMHMVPGTDPPASLGPALGPGVNE